MKCFIRRLIRRLKCREIFLVKGLPAGPGGAVGQVAFTSEVAMEWKKEGKESHPRS